ncbi:hypothetical protein [uncultured Polaribacter sp.]|uniref:hypothetical protein n=1 Tax=uncultured Polaribacter sp. TaxID=174711 RepID=UPI002610A045|nr:hypothetical protein [uncultured Polaribacter sp.]
MKTAAVIIALFLLSKPLLPILEYAAFYDYIKTELCINKDVPELKCNGKCHLAKQLAKVADTEKGNEKNQSFSIEIPVVYFQDTNLNYAFHLLKEENTKIQSSLNQIYKFQYLNTVFHPPLV